MTDERGSAVVDFVVVAVVLVPVFLGVLQLALVLHVRNTLAAAASEGARHAASADRDPEDGVALARQQVSDVLGPEYGDDMRARRVEVGGAPGVELVIRATVPALGLGGPSVDVTVRGSAVEEPAP